MSRATYRCLTISAGDGRRVMDGETGRYRRKYTVRVQSDSTNMTRRFDFFASIADEEAGKVGLSPNELLFAFYCFVTDAIAGDQSFADFCGDYGYSDDSYSARQTWTACKRAGVKLAALFHNEVDIYAMANELQDMEGVC